jgi:hypothetical protein
MWSWSSTSIWQGLCTPTYARSASQGIFSSLFLPPVGRGNDWTATVYGIVTQAGGHGVHSEPARTTFHMCCRRSPLNRSSPEAIDDFRQGPGLIFKMPPASGFRLQKSAPMSGTSWAAKGALTIDRAREVSELGRCALDPSGQDGISTDLTSIGILMAQAAAEHLVPTDQQEPKLLVNGCGPVHSTV